MVLVAHDADLGDRRAPRVHDHNPRTSEPDSDHSCGSFLPFIGDFFDSRAKPNIKIAHQVEMWLELRSIMSGDVFDQSADVWYSRELGDYMGLDRIGDAWYTKEMRMIVMGSNNEYLWRKGQDVDGCRC